jgi:hypothetical protein
MPLHLAEWIKGPLLAPYLNPKASSKLLWIGGMNSTINGPRLSLFTFGMALPLEHKEPTQLVNVNLLSLSNSIVCTMLMDQSSLLPNSQSCHGLPILPGGSNPRQLKHTSLPFVPSTQMPTSHSMPVTPPLLGASSMESKNIMVKKIVNQFSPSLFQSLLLYLPNSNPDSPRDTPAFMLPVVLPMLDFFDLANLQEGKASTMPTFTSQGNVYNSFHHSKIPPTSFLHFPAQKPIPFIKESWSPLQLLPTLQSALSPPSKHFSLNSPVDLMPHSLKTLTAPHSCMTSLSALSVPLLNKQDWTLRHLLATAFVVVQHLKQWQQVFPTTKYSFSAAGEAMHTNCTLTQTQTEFFTSLLSSTWLIPTLSLLSLCLCRITPPWLESDPFGVDSRTFRTSNFIWLTKPHRYLIMLQHHSLIQHSSSVNWISH